MSLVGRHIGRYRILEQLGQGGMSVVYKGLDTALEREVAVKVLHPHLATKAESRKRLEREAKAVARLRHPNILEVFDFAGADSPEAYIVCEYIKGKTLREFIATDSLQPPEIAAMVVHEIAAALAHAHELSVIHRDLKPENVMLREDGVLKLMDFGIAKIIDRDEKMTMTGALVGSPAHMAPEIIEGEEAGAEADIFSLGTMLYLFATGKLPFTASNTTATLRRILDGNYDDPRQEVPTVSDELAEIIGTCLRRVPSERYANAGKLRDALADYLGGLGIKRISEELSRFFADPPSYRQELTPRLTSALLAKAERFIEEKRGAKALSLLNLVLAHDPGNERTQALLLQMRAKNQRHKRLITSARVAFVAGALFIVSMGTWRGVTAARRVEDFKAPLLRHPADVYVPASAYPKPPEPPPAAAVTPAPSEPTLVAPVMPPLRATRLVRPVAAALEPTGTALADVTITVRPFGYLLIDGVARQPAEALQVHRLKVPPGRHSFTVTCELCETSGKTTELEVIAGRENAASIAAPLKPSLVSFDGYPDAAIVSVGNEQRTVAESRKTPFRISMPPEGSMAMLLSMKYRVALNGEEIEVGTKSLVPGKPTIVTRGAAP